MTQLNQLDSPEREDLLLFRILEKKSLKNFYIEIYKKYQKVLSEAPLDGIALELGSGCGFVKTIIPEMVTSDVIKYNAIDKVVNATAMPFQDKELRAIFMLNVLHHINNSPKAFQEFARCLTIGGKILIVDQYPGIPSRWILKYVHHEPFRAQSKKWEFDSQGPLSGANGALAWIIFVRDRKQFEELYPELKIKKITIHSPLRYWLTGGLKKWNLLPGVLFKFATLVDYLLIRIWQGFGSFMDIEIEKIDLTKEGHK